MPSALATCLFTVFILWLFYRNSKRNSGVSASLWVPVLWVAILASRPVGWWIGPQIDKDRNPYLDGSPIDRMVFLALMGLGIAILVRRRIAWRAFFKANPWLILFYLFCGLSVLWSDYPFVSFKRWVKEIGTLVMILVILTEKERVQAIREIFVRCAFVLIPLSILVIKYYVDIGMSWNPWTGEAYICGVTNDKNNLGRLAFVSALALLWSLVDIQKGGGWFRRIKEGLPESLVFLMSVWLLLKADSATSLGCFVLGVAVFLGARFTWVRSRPVLVGSLACAAILISLLVLAVPELRKVVANSLGRRADLTDRTFIWDRAMELKTNPLIGVGFNSVWTTPGGLELQDDLSAAHSHNGYLETYLNCGLIGVILLLGAVFMAGRNSLRQLASGAVTGPFFAALLFSGIIYNYTEVGINNMTIVGFVLWLVAMDFSSRSRPRKGRVLYRQHAHRGESDCQRGRESPNPSFA